ALLNVMPHVASLISTPTLPIRVQYRGERSRRGGLCCSDAGSAYDKDPLAPIARQLPVPLIPRKPRAPRSVAAVLGILAVAATAFALWMLAGRPANTTRAHTSSPTAIDVGFAQSMRA